MDSPYGGELCLLAFPWKGTAMHAKDLLLAVILGLAIAHNTYEWTLALRLPGRLAQAASEARSLLQSLTQGSWNDQ
jgi:hypothetical protein